MENLNPEKENAKKSKSSLPLENISAFCMEISLMLRSGIPIVHGVGTMAESEKNEDGKKILSEIFESMDIGNPFYSSLSDTGCFPGYMVSMVEIGEKSGTLEQVMLNLHSYYKKEDALQKNIKGALVYPMIMIVMMFVVLFVLITKVLPIFDNVFIQLGSSMPPFAQIVMSVGSGLSSVAIYIVGALIVAAVVVYFMNKTEKGRKKLNAIRDKYLANSQIMNTISVSRLTSALALTLSSGFDTDEALDLSSKLLNSSLMTKRIEECKIRINEGLSFSEALEKSDIIIGIYATMLTIGFQTGSADIVMQELSDRFSQQAESRISDIVSSIEPALVIILSIIVGIVLLSVMMPIWSIMSSIG